jgi:hypothetical protein
MIFGLTEAPSQRKFDRIRHRGQPNRRVARLGGLVATLAPRE